jgi:hypothetical protein
MKLGLTATGLVRCCQQRSDVGMKLWFDGDDVGMSLPATFGRWDKAGFDGDRVVFICYWLRSDVGIKLGSMAKP